MFLADNAIRTWVLVMGSSEPKVRAPTAQIFLKKIGLTLATFRNKTHDTSHEHNVMTDEAERCIKSHDVKGLVHTLLEYFLIIIPSLLFAQIFRHFKPTGHTD